MEGKNELIKRIESPIKLIDVKSNFKKVRKISPSKEVAEYGKKKKAEHGIWRRTRKTCR